MKFKTSLFSSGLIKSDVKRFWWISALYTVILFFVYPFHLMMQDPKLLDQWRRDDIFRSTRLSSGISELQIILICIVPVLLAVLLFRYMQVSKSAAMMHSLPFERKTLYFSHSAIGLVLLTLPVLLNGIVLFLLQSVTYLNTVFTPADILIWIGLTLLFNTLFFSFAIFVGMFTGNSIAQIAFTYILHVLPSGISILLDYNMTYLLHGFGRDRNYTFFMDTLPIFVLTDLKIDSLGFTIAHIITYILLTVFFFAAAMFVYEKRKLESASDIISFEVIRPVFKYGVTFCGMILGGVYFSEISKGSIPIILLGYVLCSFFSYFIAEMLIQKSFLVWNAYKGFLVYSTILAFVLSGFFMDVTGFVHRAPDADQVQRVYFGQDMFLWNHIENKTDVKEIEMKFDNTGFFESQENIQNILLLHQQLAKTPSVKEGSLKYIIYTLKNGEHLIRQYPVDEKRYSVYLKPIYESKEYKESRFPVLTQDINKIKFVEISDSRNPKKPLILSGSSEIKEFTDQLRLDLAGVTFENLMMMDSREYIFANITDTDGKVLQYSLRTNYARVFQWLKAKGHYENVVLMPKDIESVVLERNLSPAEIRAGRDKKEPVQPKRIEVKDTKVIEELLILCSTGNYRNNTGYSEYINVGFNIKTSIGSNYFSDQIYRDTPVSDGLKKYIQQLDK